MDKSLPRKKGETAVSTSISDLAPELLAKIFRFYVGELYQNRLRIDDSIVHRLIGITHICQRWRNIALDLSELWCNITLFKPEVLDHFLHYSKTRSLRICHNFGSHTHSKESWNYLLSQLSVQYARIGELDLDLPHNDMRALLSKIWKDLPHISVLNLTRQDTNDWEEAADNIIELDAIPLPSLKRVTIVSTALKLPWSSCRNLTSLSLLSPIPPSLQWKELIGVLSHSPQLRFLQVSFIEFNDSDPAGVESVSLPYLVDLILFHVQVSVISRLFHAIATLSRTFIHINLASYMLLSTNEQLQLRDAITRIGIHNNDCLELHFNVGREDILFPGLSGRGSLFISGCPSLLMRTIFDLSLVKYLYVDWTDVESSSEVGHWEVILAAFPSLSNLFLIRCKEMLVFELLARPANQMDVDSGSFPPLFCSGLKVLGVDVLPSSMRFRNGKEEFGRVTVETTVGGLLSCLGARRKLGMKVERLVLRLMQSELSPEVSRRLGELVDQVEIREA